MTNDLLEGAGQLIQQFIEDTLRREPNDRPTAKHICKRLNDFFGYSEMIHLVEQPSSVAGLHFKKDQDHSPNLHLRGTSTYPKGNQPKRKPVPSKSPNKTEINWNMIKAHIPPWFDIQTTPVLCHQFTISTRLSGAGHEEGSRYMSNTTTYCALFANVVVLCQGPFKLPDETAPLTFSDLTGFALIFLEHLGLEKLIENASESGNVLDFSIELNHDDRITFHLNQQDASFMSDWFAALRRFLGLGLQIQVDPSYLQLPFNIQKISSGTGTLFLSFAMLEPMIYLLEAGSILPRSQPEKFHAARRLRILSMAVNSYYEFIERYRASLCWEKWLASSNTVEVLLNSHNATVGSSNSPETLLHWASYLGLSEVVQILVNNKQLIREQNYAGETPLHLAVRNGGLKLVNILLESHANLVAVDRQGCTILHHAVLGHQVEVARLLLNMNPELINDKDNSGQTALFLAVSIAREKIEMVNFLIGAGADVGFEARTGTEKTTVLHHAMSCDDDETIMSLIKLIEKQQPHMLNAYDGRGRRPLLLAAELGNSSAIKALIKAGADINITGRTALHVAVRNGHCDCVKALIEGGADVFAEDYTDNGDNVLHVAARMNQTELFQILLEAKVKVGKSNWRGETPKSIAKGLGHIDILRMIEEHQRKKNVAGDGQGMFGLFRKGRKT